MNELILTILLDEGLLVFLSFFDLFFFRIASYFRVFLRIPKSDGMVNKELDLYSQFYVVFYVTRTRIKTVNIDVCVTSTLQKCGEYMP